MRGCPISGCWRLHSSHLQPCPDRLSPCICVREHLPLCNMTCSSVPVHYPPRSYLGCYNLGSISTMLHVVSTNCYGLPRSILAHNGARHYYVPPLLAHAPARPIPFLAAPYAEFIGRCWPSGWFISHFSYMTLDLVFPLFSNDPGSFLLLTEKTSRLPGSQLHLILPPMHIQQTNWIIAKTMIMILAIHQEM